MTEQRATDHEDAADSGAHPSQLNPSVDPERDTSANSFDNPTGLTGQGYSREREAEMGRQGFGGDPLSGDGGAGHRPADDPDGRDIPPDNGRRASIDPATGEVHGSGAGAGGGNEGEDFDEETPGGS